MARLEVEAGAPNRSAAESVRPTWLPKVLVASLLAWLVFLPGNMLVQAMGDLSWLGSWWFLSTAALSAAAWANWWATRGAPRRFALGIALGVTLGTVADADETLLLKPVLFMLGHLAYLYACGQAASSCRLWRPAAWTASLMAWLILGVLCWYLLVMQGSKQMDSRWPVLGYAILLAITVGTFGALALQHRHFTLAALGAALFFISDCLLAVDYFRECPSWILIVSWLNYGLGQTLIVFGSIYASPLLAVEIPQRASS